MDFKRFDELSPSEAGRLYSFFSGLAPAAPYPTAEAMHQALGSPVYNQGRNFITLWAGGDVAGTLGIITKEASTRSEVFITGLYAVPELAGEALPLLLREAYQIGRAAPGVGPETVVRLGVRRGQEHLIPVVSRAGFRETYRILELRLDVAGPETGGTPAAGDVAGAGAGAAGAHAGAPLAAGAVRFEPVTPENLEAYVAVHNAAFITSPNGGLISRADAAAALAASPHPELMQVGYLDGVPAAMVDLRLSGDTGEIDGLAVHPRFQGRGLGRLALQHALWVLQGRGAGTVRLQVVESNRPAVELYLRHGFALDQVVSTWFVGPPLLPGN